jgi:hypothetical protein
MNPLRSPISEITEAFVIHSSLEMRDKDHPQMLARNQEVA